MRERGGFALIAAVMIMVVMAALGAMLTGIFSTSARAALEYADSVKAAALADAGLRWVFAQDIDGDTNLIDNTSPTGAPPPDVSSSNSVSLGEGEFWVEYSGQTSTFMDVKVTAKVRNALRVVKSHIELKAPPAFRRVLYSDRNVNLSSASGSISGIAESQGTINPGSVNVSSATLRESSTDSFGGTIIDSVLSDPVNRNETVSAGTLTLDGSGGSPPGTYGSTSGYVWFFEPAANLVLDGANGPITINGSMISNASGDLIVTTVNDPTVTWTAYPKVLGGSGPARMIPAFVGERIVLTGNASLSITGMVVTLSDTVHLAMDSTASFSLLGIFWSNNAGGPLSPGGNISWSYDPRWTNWPEQWGIVDAPSWFDNPGLDREYPFTDWVEVLS